jgi:hypothetical protein
MAEVAGFEPTMHESKSCALTNLATPLCFYDAPGPGCSNGLGHRKVLAGPLYGAGDETRTRDINLGKVVLYRLSYSRKTSSAGAKAAPT